MAAARASRALDTPDDPTLGDNLACSLCQHGQDAAALTNPSAALKPDASGNLRAGSPVDGGFNGWREAELHPDIVGTMIIAPPRRRPRQRGAGALVRARTFRSAAAWL